MNKQPPPWLGEALLTAQNADRLKLSMDEAAWLMERKRRGKSIWHWRVFWLYLKSRRKGWGK